MRIVHAITGLSLVALVAVLPVTARAQDYVEGATEFIQELADDALEKLGDQSLTRDEREDEFRRLLNENFAVNGIARLMLGRYWRSTSPEQRAEYLRLYQDVLAATWAGPFSRAGGVGLEITQSIVMRAARTDENAVLVRSTIDMGTGRPLEVSWRVANKGDVYKIADIVIQGISMVTTQRDEFVSVIRQNNGDVDGLLALLREQRVAARADQVN